MLIQVNTDTHVEGREALLRWAEAETAAKLRRYRDHVTRVEIHLSDTNAGKAGEKDKRCLMEARVAGQTPLAVSHQASTLADALNGAIEKLKSALASVVGRRRDHGDRSSIRNDTDVPDDTGSSTPPP
jgi:hypothetical protein